MVSGEKLDFAMDFAALLGARTISSTSWAALSGLTQTAATPTTTQAGVRITSTTPGVYLPQVTAVLSTSEEEIRAFRLEVVTRIVVQDLVKAVGAKFKPDALPWADELDGDPISSRAWGVGAGLSILSGGTTAQPMLQATAAGLWYATEHLVCASGQEHERAIVVAVRGL